MYQSIRIELENVIWKKCPLYNNKNINFKFIELRNIYQDLYSGHNLVQKFFPLHVNSFQLNDKSEIKYFTSNQYLVKLNDFEINYNDLFDFK